MEMWGLTPSQGMKNPSQPQLSLPEMERVCTNTAEIKPPEFKISLSENVT